MSQEISVSSDIIIITGYVKVMNGKRDKNKVMYKERAITQTSPRKQILSIHEQPIKPDLPIMNVALVICNSYYSTAWDLGDSAINDGLLAYEKFKEFNYQTIVLYDSTINEFKKVFKQHLSSHYNNLVLFYIGHGTQVKDTNKDEADGLDECLLFKDGTFKDDELAKLILSNNTAKKLTLISDCCHSATIYDMPSRSDIITISACRDDQTAKQDWIEHKGNGVFSYYFWKYLPTDNDKINELKKKINAKLKVYNQTCVFNYSPNYVL